MNSAERAHDFTGRTDLDRDAIISLLPQVSSAPDLLYYLAFVNQFSSRRISSAAKAGVSESEFAHILTSLLNIILSTQAYCRQYFNLTPLPATRQDSGKMLYSLTIANRAKLVGLFDQISKFTPLQSNSFAEFALLMALHSFMTNAIVAGRRVGQFAFAESIAVFARQFGVHDHGWYLLLPDLIIRALRKGGFEPFKRNIDYQSNNTINRIDLHSGFNTTFLNHACLVTQGLLERDPRRIAEAKSGIQCLLNFLTDEKDLPLPEDDCFSITPAFNFQSVIRAAKFHPHGFSGPAMIITQERESTLKHDTIILMPPPAFFMPKGFNFEDLEAYSRAPAEMIFRRAVSRKTSSGVADLFGSCSALDALEQEILVGETIHQVVAAIETSASASSAAVRMAGISYLVSRLAGISHEDAIRRAFIDAGKKFFDILVPTTSRNPKRSDKRLER